MQLPKSAFVFILFYIASNKAISQTDYNGGDNALSRTIQKALVDAELNITQNFFQLVAVEVKGGKLISIESLSNDTTGNFQIIREAIITATRSNWKRKKRRLVILIPFFFVKRNSEAPFAVHEWSKDHPRYLEAQRTVLLSPIHFLCEGERLRSKAP